MNERANGESEGDGARKKEKYIERERAFNTHASRKAEPEKKERRNLKA